METGTGARKRRRPAGLEEYETDDGPARKRTEAANLKTRITRLQNKLAKADEPETKARLHRQLAALIVELDAVDPEAAERARQGPGPARPAVRRLAVAAPTEPVKWEPPTVENFDWGSLVVPTKREKDRAKAQKEERRAEERQSRLDNGQSRAEIRALFKWRDEHGKRGRPTLQISNAEYNTYLKQKVINDEQFWGTSRLWGLISEDPNKPAGLSRRYLDRWRRAVEVFEVHRRWVSDPDILRRAPLSGRSARFVTWQCDLKTMREQNGLNYVLVIVNNFSKFLWTRNLREKTQESVTAMFKDVLDSVPQALRPRLLVRDGGVEFAGPFEQLLKERNIKSTVSPPGRPQANGQAERAVQVVGRLISQYEKQTGKKDWPQALPRLVRSYNNTKAFATGEKPSVVEGWIQNGNEDELDEVAERIRKAVGLDRPGNPPNQAAVPKYKVGDIVRFRLGQGAGLAKSGGWNWSTLPAKVTYREAGKNGVIRYKIEDQHGQEIPTAQGEWWSNDQLLLFVPPLIKMESEPTYIIRSILAPRVYERNGQREPGYVVSWVGYGPRDNTVEPRRLLLEDVPSWLTSFEARNNVKWQGNNFTWTKQKKTVTPRTTTNLQRQRDQQEAAAAAAP